MSEDSEDAAGATGHRPTISVSVPPQQRDAFFAALARLRQAHGDEPVSVGALIVDAVVQQAAVADAARVSSGASSPDQPPPPHLLIVDDDDTIRETLRAFFEGAGYIVAEAAEGVSALSLLVNSPHRLVALLDNLMPGLNANEVLAALEADHDFGCATDRHAFILMTASLQRLSAALAARLGRLGAPIVAKPFDWAPC